MLLMPINLNTPVESEDWEDFSLRLTRDFFAKHSECGSAVLMLVPLPQHLPLIAAADDVDDEATIERALNLFAAQQTPFRTNSCGQIALVFPVDVVDEAHKDRAFAMLKGIADGLGAVAVSVIAECWLRQPTKPAENVRGTGEDSVVVLVERVGREATASIATINARTATLGEWRRMPGTVRGRLSGWLSRANDKDDNDGVPAGFTAKVNVSTIGEA